MTSVSTKKLRSSNFELYRIIVMLLIVAHHYVVNSGLVDKMYLQPFSANSIYLFLFGMWGKTGINCFVLITGYFMCKSRITLYKYMRLILEVLFYNGIIYIIFCMSGYSSFSILSFLRYLNPITSVDTGFTSAFLLFYLFIPFLNILLVNLRRRQHLALLGLCLFVYTILGQIPRLTVTINYVSWFIVLYFIASFIRLYPIKMFEDKALWRRLTFVSVVLAMLTVLVGLWATDKFSLRLGYFFVSDSNALFAVVVAVTSFLYIKNIKIPYNKFINIAGASSFGVLLIHANSDIMRQWLWVDLLGNVTVYDTSLLNLIIHSVLSCSLVWLSCTFIDIIRIYLLERPLLKKIETLLESIEVQILAKLN